MAIPVAGLAIAALWVAIVSVVLSALNGIYRTALYMYAAGEPATGYFTQEQLEAAFTPKRSRFV